MLSYPPDTILRPFRHNMWSDCPTELKRYIFSFLPYWEIQKKRGVSRHWCTVADSLNPNYRDAESLNVLAFSLEHIKTVEKAWVEHSKKPSWRRHKAPWVVCKTWRWKEVVYDAKASYAANWKIVDVVEFIKCNMRPFWSSSNPIDRRLKGYKLDGVIICECEFCCKNETCHQEYSSLCKHTMCGNCCKDPTCVRGHTNKKRFKGGRKV